MKNTLYLIILLIIIFLAWCGHCKTLTPEFNKAAKELQEKGINIAFGNIDATIELQLAEKFDIQGYPTIKMFIDGVPVNYESGRKSQDIIDWVEKKVNKKSIEINSNQELDKLIAEQQILVVYFGENNREFQLFQRISKQFDDIQFFHTFSSEIKEHFAANKIVLFKQFDEKRNDYTNEFDIADIYEFISLHSVPIIIDFEAKAVQLVFGELKPAIIMFLDPQKHQNEFTEFQTASLQLKDKILIIKCIIDEGYGYKFAEFIGVTAEQLPQVYIGKVEGQDFKKYKLENSIKSENLIEFYNEYLEGKLIPIRKSEDIPEENNGPVIKVVGKQFDQIVMDTTKDVLVKYYAPWCIHSKQLAPIYEKVAQILKINPNIIIAEYDASVNENEGVSIEGFPTVIFYPAKNKQEQVKYQESRTKSGIISFLKQYATVEWIEPEISELEEDEEDDITENKSEL